MKNFKQIIAIILLLFLLFWLNKHNVLKGFKPSDIKDYILSFGVYAPFIYILLFAIVPLTLFPDSILAIASGMVFGLIHGFIYTMIGAVCGGTLAFFLSRFLGRDFLIKHVKHFEVLDKKIESNGFMIVLLLRLIPLFPFDIISYSAGLSKVKYSHYILATLIGIIPGVFVFTNLGDKSIDVGSNAFYISLALLILLFTSTILLKKKINLNNTKAAD